MCQLLCVAIEQHTHPGAKIVEQVFKSQSFDRRLLLLALLLHDLHDWFKSVARMSACAERSATVKGLLQVGWQLADTCVSVLDLVCKALAMQCLWCRPRFVSCVTALHMRSVAAVL